MLRLQIAPKCRGHLACERSYIALDLPRALRPENDARDSRVTQGEMQRRGWQGNAMGMTDAFDLGDLGQDLRWSVPIIVFGAARRAACLYA